MSKEFQDDERKNIHDCYNTIAAMTCYAQFLMQDIPPDSEMHKFAKSIFVSSKRAKLLLDEITADGGQNRLLTDSEKKVV